MNVQTSDGTPVDTAGAVRAAVEAAVWAPSLHNSQPWSFAIAGDEISLRADPDRKLHVADEAGRQMLIGCGAALFSVRTTLRALGHRPETRVQPDPESPLLIATVRSRPGAGGDESARLLHAEIRRRRTHRGGFTARPVDDQLVEALVGQASAEGAGLTPVRADAAIRVLASLTTAAQEVQAQDRRFTLEVMRWARPPGSVHQDGVHPRSYPAAPRQTHPYHFPQRDYARGHQWGEARDDQSATATGLVALLTTTGDSAKDWLAAGQALQRVLLHASAHGLSAAFHSQALEMPDLRKFIRDHLCNGEHPQMIIRFGFAPEDGDSVRRSSGEVVQDSDR